MNKNSNKIEQEIIKEFDERIWNFLSIHLHNHFRSLGVKPKQAIEGTKEWEEKLKSFLLFSLDTYKKGLLAEIERK